MDKRRTDDRELEKRCEPISVPQELREKILTVVDSNYMRDYMEEECGYYNVFHWTELISGAPRPMELKIKLLRDLLEVPMNGEAHLYLEACCKEADDAMDKLWSMDSGKSVLLATGFDSDYPDPARWSTHPFRSYEDFLRSVREDFSEEGENLDEQSDYQTYYFKLELYDVTEGSYERKIEYFCTPNGKAHYYNWDHKIARPRDRDHEQERMEEYFGGRRNLESWMAPYRVGDILYVDLRPYYKPTYCLIGWICPGWAFDCCGIQCLYPLPGGMVGMAPLKHGRCLPQIMMDAYDPDRQFFSPLYRAEPYTGELPDEYAFMKPVSERLKAEPELSDRIDECFYGDFTCDKRVDYAYRPVPVEEPEWGEEDPSWDVLWHPDPGKRQWWENTGSASGITRGKLFELAGITEDNGKVEKNGEE